MSTANELMSPQERGSVAQRERRSRILDATLALASGGGYDAVQMRAVAERADVALGTLYRYFPSKVHLLVSVLAREFEQAELQLRDKPIPGDNPADRVIALLRRLSRGLQADPQLTEALTRAFMFADASVSEGIHRVGMLLTTMMTRVIRPDVTDPTDEDIAVAKVIGDVWLSALVAWVTGRATGPETAQQLEVAVRLLLRDGD